MVSLDTLALINRQCKAAKAQAVTSPDLFGGLPIVIFMGDFFSVLPRTRLRHLARPQAWK
jgi:hypothetical protein